jgi:hypothetical protein
MPNNVYMLTSYNGLVQECVDVQTLHLSRGLNNATFIWPKMTKWLILKRDVWPTGHSDIVVMCIDHAENDSVDVCMGKCRMFLG